MSRSKEYKDCDKWPNHHIRVLLFDENGLRGRKLIYDSSIVQNETSREYKSYQTDIQALTEMVFGSITLRCCKTCFKIHHLSAPYRLMFTEIFSIFPSRTRHLCKSSFDNVHILSTNNSVLSCKGSSVLGSKVMCGCYAINDNPPSCSDTTICTADSGFMEQSFYSKTSSSLSSFNKMENLMFSKFELCNLESEPYVKNSVEFMTGFGEESLSKLWYNMGIMFIVVINTDMNNSLNFYLKHVAFFEAVICRVRKIVEATYNKPKCSISTMIEISNESIEYLRSFLSNAQILKNIDFYESTHKQQSWVDNFKLQKLLVSIRKSGKQYNGIASMNNGSGVRFTQFCELLKKLEIRERNLFMSTLVTAMLTYHLGWVTTCLPLHNNHISYSRNSYNSLWIHISELYGTLVYPLKSCQTVINSSKINTIISDILKSLDYFIRYSKVEFRRYGRNFYNIIKENITANVVCHKEIHNMQSQQTKVNILESFPTNSFSIFLCEEQTLFNKKNIPKQRNLHFILGDDDYSNTVDATREPTSVYTPISKIAAMTTNCTVPYKKSENFIDTERKFNKTVILHTQEAGREFLDVKLSPKQINSFLESSSKLFEQSVTYTMGDSERYDIEEQYCIKPTVKVLKRNTDIFHKLKLLIFPLPSSESTDQFKMTSYASTLRIKNIGKYIPDVVTQGTTLSEEECSLRVKKAVFFKRNNCNKYVEDLVVIVGNVDQWNVQIFSSSISTINHNDSGVRIEISSLVENMLEITLQMWHEHIFRNCCITHMEQRLLEMCLYSMGVAHFLLETEFCSMDLLTASLHLHVNDVPLLLSVASIVVPQVTKKYGFSFK